MTLLHKAIKQGNPEIVQLLLARQDIDVNSKSNDHQSYGIHYQIFQYH